MAEIEGALSCKAALAKLAKTPPHQRARGMYAMLAKEFYAEIREAKLAGHSWTKIAEEMSKPLKRELNKSSLINEFRRVDRWYEQETGVPAIEERKRGRRKKHESTAS